MAETTWCIALQPTQEQPLTCRRNTATTSCPTKGARCCGEGLLRIGVGPPVVLGVFPKQQGLFGAVVGQELLEIPAQIPKNDE
jgi:hypothetical protein